MSMVRNLNTGDLLGNPGVRLVTDGRLGGKMRLIRSAPEGHGAGRAVLREALNHPDLYTDLEAVPYSVEVVLEFAEEGSDVFHCPTPTWANRG